MTVLSYRDKIIKESALVYSFWASVQGGDRQYFILEVDKIKHSRFLKELETHQSIALEDYGQILYSNNVPPNIHEKDSFCQKYGIFQT